MEVVLHSSAGWVQLVCTILWFLCLLFCFSFSFLLFSSRHFAFYGQAFAISFCLTQSMIRCVHSSSKATIRSRNRSRSQQPEHFRWLATASAVAPLTGSFSSSSSSCLSPFLSVCVCVVLSSAHETPSCPLRRWGCLFSVLYTFHVMRKLNSFRYRTMITFGPVRPHHHPKMSSRNWCCSMCNERMERGVALLGLPVPLPYSPITFFCLWFAYAVAKLVSSLFGSCHKFTKVFLYAKACSRTCFVLHLLLLLLVAAGDGEAAVIESIDAFATRIS